jgi:hypothetical protein
MIKTAKGEEDYSETLYKYYGRPGWIIGMVAAILYMYGGVVLVYYELLA